MSPHKPQKKRQSIPALSWARWCLIAGLLFGQVTLVKALIYPTAPPPGGRSATFIDNSNSIQQKLGSLIIGQSSTPKKLCLGSNKINDTVDASNCITDWSDIGDSMGGPFVNLRTEDISAIESALGPDLGYVRLRGDDGTKFADTLKIDAGVFDGTATNLYADGGRADRYAGYFFGTLAVEPIDSSINGKLCLNTYEQVIDPTGHSCISSWDAVSIPTLTDNLELQNPPLSSEGLPSSPVVQYGSVALSQAFQAGSMIIGQPPAPPTELSGTYPFCGDGICSSAINEATAGSANYCAFDCLPITGPALGGGPFINVLRYPDTSGLPKVVIDVTLDHQLSNGTSLPRQSYLLIVRSTNPNFAFEPVDGGRYDVGGTPELTIIQAGNVSTGTVVRIVDNLVNNMILGKTYYYRLYTGNRFPRFKPTRYWSGAWSSEPILFVDPGG